MCELKHMDVENDKIEFDPEKYNNISIKVTGHLHGTITLLRANNPDTTLCQIINKIYVTDDHIKVKITPTYSENQLTLLIEGPIHYAKVKHETEVIFPHSLKSLESFTVVATNTSVEALALPTLFFDRYNIQTTNGSIDSRLLKSTNVILQSTNGSITGTYQPLANFIAETSNGGIDSSITSSSQLSNIELKSVNGSIKGFYRFSTNFLAETTNGSINIQGHLKENENIDARLGSTNGAVALTLSKVYAGRFQLETSWGPTSVSELNDVKFDNFSRSVKTGTKGLARPGSGNIKLSTMNAGAKLEFI
ncbi:hypothetical protein G9A89_005349 [Geosiphon pyriformis]|nr:hypothetical protein G9A89_005349 [Geosiphon pyriformis]